jgi:lysophospholipase L1-like esterase
MVDISTLGAAKVAAARAGDLRYPQTADVKRLADLRSTYSAIDPLHPVLDLNYADRMALYGIETYTRSTTTTYNDRAGASQTAAVDVAAFDRQARLGVGWFLPAGLKGIGNGIASFNATGMLPDDYTLVVDVDRPNAYSGAGTILSLNSGSATHRVEIACAATYQAAFYAQANGVVVVNQALGANQVWYGGPRRLVFAVKSANWAVSDDGQSYASINTGVVPPKGNLTTLSIGGGAWNTSYFTGWIKRVQMLPAALSLTQVVNLAAGAAPVACWGDSLTAGTGASVSTYYPELLRLSRYPHSGVYNGGVGGETSTQIRVRQLADTIRRDWTNVIWVGRNNFTDPAVVLADVRAMVANLTHNRFLIMSTINKADGTENAGSTNYNQIIAVNNALAAAYPGNYLDIRASLVAASGGTNDAPNNSWTADGLHLNGTGYAHVAGQVSAWLRAKQWY